MITEISLGLTILSVVLALFTIITLTKIRNYHPAEHEDGIVLHLMSITFLFLTIFLYVFHLIQNTYPIGFIPTWLPLAGIALFTLPLTVLTLLVTLFQLE